MEEGLRATKVRKITRNTWSLNEDQLAVEEPLEIRIGDNSRHKAISITMRTPGEDIVLALGFLFSEGIISDPEEVAKLYHCGPKNKFGNSNIVRIEFSEDGIFDEQKFQRNFYSTSSCGVCGKASIEALKFVSKFKISRTRISSVFLNRAPNILKNHQRLFQVSAGTHAAGLFDSRGVLKLAYEDVGRHNALDKIIGKSFLDRNLPLADCFLVLTGRLGFELIQKAAMAGIPVVAGVGVPSSLAVELAEKFGISLVGFLNSQRMNVYTHQDQIVL